MLVHKELHVKHFTIVRSVLGVDDLCLKLYEISESALLMSGGSKTDHLTFISSFAVDAFSEIVQNFIST